MAAASHRHLVVASMGWFVFVAGCRDETDQAAGVSDQNQPATDEESVASPNRRSSDTPKPPGRSFSFQTIAAESGLDFERYDDIRGQHRILEANGGGVGLFDFDRDGRLDVFLTNGCRLPRNPDDRETPCQLFRNRGAMQFDRVTDTSLVRQFGYTHGCAVGDVDADGFDDLYVTAYGRNALWRNNGDGTFSDITDATGTQVPQWSSSAAFADLDVDGDLDLYVTNYLDESDESPKLCPNAASPDGYEQCSPAVFDGVDDALFLSDGEGGFVDATATAGLAGLKGKGLGVVIGDLDNDCPPEIYVANDGQANFLLVARGDEGRGTRDERQNESATGLSSLVYDERALAGNIALNELGYAQASMGIAAGDYDANGTTDLFLTNFYGDTSTLYANRSRLLFEDATRASRIGAASRRTLGWGTVFVDIDNDGWLDLLVTNGHVDDRTWMPQGGEPYQMRPKVYRNRRDGTFADVSDSCGDYFTAEWLGRGLAVGDLDRDGCLDAVVAHQLAPSIALRNETSTAGRSLVLQLVGVESNRNGYCARVEVLNAATKIDRTLFGGGSFQSASAPEVHVGLGDLATATVRLHWPSGTIDTHDDLSAGQWIAVEGRSVFAIPR
ncbi:MAG: CRTAC1 family protein [Planctomycetaceae bacterium]